MTFERERFFVTASAALILAGCVAACAGQSNSALPSSSFGGALQRESRMPVPAPHSTEFFNGIPANANPKGISLGPRGMWFTETGTDEIARVTTAGIVTQFPGPADGVNNIARGADGNLWFTTGADTIGRMTPSGKIKTFPTGNEAYGPFDIVAGPDGNLWFTFRSPSTNAIGKITIQGAVTLYTNGLSPGDVAVHDITLGPDGRLWFTEEFGNRIGAITTGGAIAEYSNGISTGAGLADITAGPDGNLWFSEYSLNQIGRITPSGNVTEFSQGISPQAGPASMTQADGYVWFTELNAHNLGRVSTSGAITEVPVPGSEDADVALGQTDTLWLTDYSGNGVVRFKP